VLQKRIEVAFYVAAALTAAILTYSPTEPEAAPDHKIESSVTAIGPEIKLQRVRLELKDLNEVNPTRTFSI